MVPVEQEVAGRGGGGLERGWGGGFRFQYNVPAIVTFPSHETPSPPILHADQRPAPHVIPPSPTRPPRPPTAPARPGPGCI